jgi:parallel beta-helix repeat protein
MESNNYNFHVHGAIPGYFDHIIYPDNLVNGKPLYYLNEQSDIEIPSDAGQVYVINSTNITVKDIEMSDTSYGVVFVATEESTIENVTLSESLCGIYLLNSGPNVLDKIRSNNNLVGMMIEGSSNITMSCSSINSNHFGVMLRELDNSTLANVNASGNSFVGIALFSCTDNYLRQNMANSNIYGLQLLDSNNNHLMENTVSNNSNVGIYLSTSPDNTLSGNVASYNRIAGLRISSSDNNTLTGNTFTNNTLSLQEAASVSLNAEISALQQTIEQISINDVDNAISPDSENIVSSISLNDVQPGFHGVYILNSDNILLSNTHATGNDYALYASGSLNTTVSNLVLTEELSQMSFVSNENRLILRENCLDPISLPGKINVNGYVDLFRSPGEQFNIHLMPADTGIDIRFFYNDSGMSSAGESTISLYRLNGSQWVKVPDATLNTNDNYVCATITVAEANPAINAVMETYEATLALFKDVESSISGSQAPDSGSSVMARERREGTISDLPMGEEGGVNGDFVVTSSSGTTTITLYEGTKALDPSGNPVSRIIITTPSSLPAGTPQEVIRSGLYIRFGPSGTTFSQDIMVTMDFNPQDFKDRAPVIYTYTSEDGWIALETTVDWENGRATAMISHFSLYALFGTDVQEKQEVVVQTRIADEKPSSGLTEGTPVENKADKGYVYWTIGTVIILVLGITVVSRQKNKRGL